MFCPIFEATMPILVYFSILKRPLKSSQGNQCLLQTQKHKLFTSLPWKKTKTKVISNPRHSQALGIQCCGCQAEAWLLAREVAARLSHCCSSPTKVYLGGGRREDRKVSPFTCIIDGTAKTSNLGQILGFLKKIQLWENRQSINSTWSKVVFIVLKLWEPLISDKTNKISQHIAISIVKNNNDMGVCRQLRIKLKNKTEFRARKCCTMWRHWGNNIWYKQIYMMGVVVVVGGFLKGCN